MAATPAIYIPSFIGNDQLVVAVLIAEFIVFTMSAESWQDNIIAELIPTNIPAELISE